MLSLAFEHVSHQLVRPWVVGGQPRGLLEHGDRLAILLGAGEKLGGVPGQREVVGELLPGLDQKLGGLFRAAAHIDRSDLEHARADVVRVDRPALTRVAHGIRPAFGLRGKQDLARRRQGGEIAFPFRGLHRSVVALVHGKGDLNLARVAAEVDRVAQLPLRLGTVIVLECLDRQAQRDVRLVGVKTCHGPVGIPGLVDSTDEVVGHSQEVSDLPAESPELLLGQGGDDVQIAARLEAGLDRIFE